MGEHEKPDSFFMKLSSGECLQQLQSPIPTFTAEGPSREEISQWWKKLTDFIEEYLVLPEGWHAGEILPEPHARICLYVLLHEGVFSDAKDLQEQAYEDYGILIPEEMMEAVVSE